MTSELPRPDPDHPHRAALVEELHARPFPAISAPSTAWFVALRPERRAMRDRAAERAQLDRLITGACLTLPDANVTHWSGRLGPVSLKWESHTEFVTFLIWGGNETDITALSQEIMTDAPGLRIASAKFRLQHFDNTTDVHEKLAAEHSRDSLAAAKVLEGQAVIAGDFSPDTSGDMRFSVFVEEQVGPKRIGRTVQRLCEIETYRSMAMLGWIRAREMGPALSDVGARLSLAAGQMGAAKDDAESTLAELLDISARLELLSARASYRMAATTAYERIVTSRIEALREERFEGRQTFAEFMLRRFDPAMRTVDATERRLIRLTERARRGAELLRTRVEVELSRQNRELLLSMDKRSDEALRLQHTVEGLSVVAISYYATGLALYVLDPVASEVGLEKGWLAAIVTPIVVLSVWGALRAIRKRLH
jgi:uncharacterized membrane-anchored protein